MYFCFYLLSQMLLQKMYDQTQGDTPYTYIHNWSWKCLLLSLGLHILPVLLKQPYFYFKSEHYWNFFQILLYNFQCVWSGFINTTSTLQDIKLTLLHSVSKFTQNYTAWKTVTLIILIVLQTKMKRNYKHFTGTSGNPEYVSVNFDITAQYIFSRY
jgi:hypothetical protein